MSQYVVLMFFLLSLDLLFIWKLFSKKVSISILIWANFLWWCYRHHWVRLRGVIEDADFSLVMPLIPRSQPYLVVLNYIFRYVLYYTIQYTYFCTYVPEHMYTITHVLTVKQKEQWGLDVLDFFLSMRWPIDHSLFW